jgi:hypothetical protein
MSHFLLNHLPSYLLAALILPCLLTMIQTTQHLSLLLLLLLLLAKLYLAVKLSRELGQICQKQWLRFVDERRNELWNVQTQVDIRNVLDHTRCCCLHTPNAPIG